MTKEEFLSYVKEKFASLGYRSRRLNFYKLVDDDYLVGFSVFGSTFCRGYSFTCGGVYLPNEFKIPFCGKFDLERDFVFPMRSINDKRSIYECIEDLGKKYSYKNNIFEYELFTLEELDLYFDVNYEHIAKPYFDKNYGLERFKSDWRLMRGFSAKTVTNLCDRAGLDADEVLRFLKMT